MRKLFGEEQGTLSAQDEQFRSLFAELKHLDDDIPPIQMSSERLRDAILSQGMKPRRRLAWGLPAWLGGATMVAACAIAITMTMRNGDNGSSLVSQTPESNSAAEIQRDMVATGEPSNPVTEPAPEAVIEQVAPVVSAPKPIISVGSKVTSSVASVRKRSPRNRSAAPVAAKEARNEATSMAAPMAAAGGSGMPGGEMAVKSAPSSEAVTLDDPAILNRVAAMDSEPSDDSTVLVVSGERDASSGALDAVEVKRPHDLVFGG